MATENFVTREDLNREVKDLRDLVQLRVDSRFDMLATKIDTIVTEMRDMRTGMAVEMKAMRTDMTAEMKELNNGTHALDVRLARIETVIKWVAGITFTVVTSVATIGLNWYFHIRG